MILPSVAVKADHVHSVPRELVAPAHGPVHAVVRSAWTVSPPSWPR